MKKSLIMLTALLSISSLAACGGGGGGSTSSSEPVPVTDWTDAEKATMKAELGGYVIPFYYVKDQTVSNQYVGYGYPIVVSAKTATVDDLKGFEKKLVAADYSVNVAVGSDAKSPSYGCYSYDISKTASVDVEFFIGTRSETSGAYTVQVLYSDSSKWPEREVAAAVKLLTEEEVTIPSVDEATFYESNNLIYSYGYLDVSCTFDDVATAAQAYNAKLIESSFTLQMLDSYGYHYYSAGETIEVVLYYSVTDGYLTVTIQQFEKPLAEWPAEDIDAAVKTLFPETTTVVPSVDADGYYFSDYTASYGAFTIRALTSDSATLLAKYVDILTNNGYSKALDDSYGYAWYVNSNADLAIEIKACSGYLAFYCETYIAEWPSALAEYLATMDITSEIPQYTGPGLSYAVVDYSQTSYSCVLLAIFNGVLSEYTTILTNAGWNVVTTASSCVAYDPAKEAMAYLYDYSSTDGYIAAQIYHYADPEMESDGDTWPSTLVDKYNTEYCGGSADLKIPAATGTAFSTFIQYDYSSLHDYIFFITVTGDVAAYQTVLTTAGFTYDEDSEAYVKSDTAGNSLYIWLPTGTGLFQIQAYYFPAE